MAAPDSKCKEPHVLSLGSESAMEAPKTPELLVAVAGLFDSWSFRAFVHSFRMQDESAKIEDREHRIRYEGAMDKKTWAAEWE